MSTFFIILGILAIIGVIAGVVLYLLDLPPQSERIRIEQTIAESAWRIHEHTKEAIDEMLDAARRQRGER